MSFPSPCFPFYRFSLNYSVVQFITLFRKSYFVYPIIERQQQFYQRLNDLFIHMNALYHLLYNHNKFYIHEHTHIHRAHLTFDHIKCTKSSNTIKLKRVICVLFICVFFIHFMGCHIITFFCCYC